MKTFWCEQAWIGGDRPDERVAISVEGDQIVGVAAGVEPAPHDLRLMGLTMPGIANGHSHAFHRALRGRTHHGSGSFWTWRDEMYQVAASLTPDSYRALAVDTFTEMLHSGYTAVGEFHYLRHDAEGRPYAEPNAMAEAVVSAATEVGIRITMLDALYTHGGIDAHGTYVAPVGPQRRFAETPERWASRVASVIWSDPLVRGGVAVHSVRAVDPQGAAAVAARAGAGPIHAHVSEQPRENEQCLAAHGKTPVELLGAAGVGGQQFTAVHATHLSESDIKALGGSVVCFCPTTERDLADGIGPSQELAKGGAGLCIGSDSHAVIDPFEEMRAVELNARLASGIRGNHATAELWQMGTAAGYRSLGWEGGAIAVGQLADFISVELSERLGSLESEHVLGSVLYGAGRDDVKAVVVGGVVHDVK